MKKGHYIFLTALLAVSAVMGVLAAGRIFRPQTALAQEGATEVMGAKVLRIVDGSGEVRMLVTTTDDKQGNIIFLDSNKKVRAVYGLSKQGEPVISMVDKNDKQRLVMAVTEEEGAALELYDKDENTIWPKDEASPVDPPQTNDNK